jgi:uncharacterized membrane protein
MHIEATEHKKRAGFFERLKPWHRVFLAVAVSLTAFFILPCGDNKSFNSLVILDFFSSAYLLFCWIVLLSTPISCIRRNASKEDKSKLLLFGMIILASLAGMVSVLLLILNHDPGTSKKLFLLVSVSGIIFSWAIVHTVFTFHYAHLFYSGKNEGGLEFPGDDDNYKPDYLDFIYFSFIIGCTFQVSDVQISSRKIRRVVLIHGLLAFILNTFVVALSINIVSGLLKL